MLDILKQKTTHIHYEIEALSLARYIIDHSITESKFNEFLVRNYLAYRFIEQKLESTRDVLHKDVASFITSDKSSHLLMDLNGLTPSYCPTHNKADLSILSHADAIGALYVIEGSMLGSCVINKHLGRCTKLIKKQEQHFFNDNTHATVGRWKSFSKAISRFSFAEKDQYNAVIAAKKAFLVFKHYYTIEL